MENDGLMLRISCLAAMCKVVGKRRPLHRLDETWWLVVTRRTSRQQLCRETEAGSLCKAPSTSIACAGWACGRSLRCFSAVAHTIVSGNRSVTDGIAQLVENNSIRGIEDRVYAGQDCAVSHCDKGRFRVTYGAWQSSAVANPLHLSYRVVDAHKLKHRPRCSASMSWTQDRKSTRLNSSHM